MKILIISQSILIVFLTILSISSYYITFTNIHLVLNISLLIALSFSILTLQKGNLKKYQKFLILLSPLLIANGNLRNLYFISILLFLHTLSIIKFKFNLFEILLEILFITTLTIFLILYFYFKNTSNQKEELVTFSQNGENILKSIFIDEGGLGASQYIILNKNIKSLMNQEIEICYNSDNVKWINNDELNINESIVKIKNIDFILKRPKSGKCLTHLNNQ